MTLRQAANSLLAEMAMVIEELDTNEEGAIRTRDLCEKALTQAHAEGYAKGLEDAAKVAEGRITMERTDTTSGAEVYWRGAIAAAIRALRHDARAREGK